MGGRYGESSLTMPEAIAYFKERQATYAPGAEEQASAIESTEVAANPPTNDKRAAALAGSQITIGLGFNGVILVEYSFLHTALDFTLYDHDVLKLDGQSAAWVLTQRVKNTAYKNISFKQLAQKICDAYGLTLDMSNDGPKYEYFPQRGVSDYQALLIEARRIGYRMTCKGNTLTIKPRGPIEAFTLIRGENLGDSFTLSHSAQGSSSGGARASDPSNRTTTGQRKIKIDPDTGKQEIIKPENLVGAGVSPEQFTTGAAVAVVAPRTDGATDEQDKVNKDNETRVKGIEAAWSAPTTPELLLVDPDSAIRTEGISTQMDRVWVCENVTHSLSDSGFSSNGAIYSPLKNKYPQPEESATGTTAAGVPPLNPNGLIKPSNGIFTSGFRTALRPNHQGIDLAGQTGDPIWASADGVVEVPAFDADGYGNWVIIIHAEGLETFYGHLSEIKVTNGQQVKQGQVIGLEGSTGRSTGPHVHHQVMLNGTPVNPENYYKAR